VIIYHIRRCLSLLLRLLVEGDLVLTNLRHNTIVIRNMGQYCCDIMIVYGLCWQQQRRSGDHIRKINSVEDEYMRSNGSLRGLTGERGSQLYYVPASIIAACWNGARLTAAGNATTTTRLGRRWWRGGRAPWPLTCGQKRDVANKS